MKYRCRQCNYISNEPGNCPTCNIPMQELLQQDEGTTPEATPETATTDAPSTDDAVVPETTPSTDAPSTDDAVPETTPATEAPAMPETSEAPEGEPATEGGDEEKPA